MTHLRVRPGPSLSGTTSVPGDKSLSHRAVIFGALAQGTSHVDGWLAAGDTEATLGAIQGLGVAVDRLAKDRLKISGGALKPPTAPLNLRHAGTGIRLLAGVMAGQPFESVLDGSDQLRRRPMGRIITPLAQMGANITANDGKAPLSITPAPLRGIRYEMPVASAQVKSAVLLAGLFAEGETTVVDPGFSRDHTERMLSAMGANVAASGQTVTLKPGEPLAPMTLRVPGDFSSAAFLIVAGLVVPDSRLEITHVNLNDTRVGLAEALTNMNAPLRTAPGEDQAGEPQGSIHVETGALTGTEISGGLVVRMIDELPILMVAALRAKGRTEVKDAQELRVKETDRIAVMVSELSKMGAEIEERPDGFVIEGPQTLKGAEVDGHDDHRMAMSLTVAGMLAEGETLVRGIDCANDSFPGFVSTMQALGADLTEVPE